MPPKKGTHRKHTANSVRKGVSFYKGTAPRNTVRFQRNNDKPTPLDLQHYDKLQK